jgi:hypothetical protein
MELLGYVGHVESRFGPFGDSVSVGARLVHGLGQTYHKLRNHFGHTRWHSFVARLKWKLIVVHFEIVSVQDWCTVCAKCTIGIKTILDAPKGTPRFEAQVEAHFNPFRDSANIDTR